MNIALLIKGDLRHLRRVRADVATLRKALPEAAISELESRSPGDTVDLAASACADSDYLIAVGGDGTLHEVLNGCLRNGDRDALPSLGQLAYGTANDFARTVGIRGDVQELIGLLQHEECRRIDIGRVGYREESGETAQRFFLNSADIGIGAEVIANMQRNQQILGHNLRYLRNIFSTFRTFRHKTLHVRSDSDLDWQGKTLALVAANGRYFGSGLCVAPGARVDDGELFITLVGDASTVDFVRNLPKLKRGDLLQHPEASYHRAHKLEVTHSGDAAAVEADGELLGTTPAEIEIVPGAVRFLCPGSETIS